MTGSLAKTALGGDDGHVPIRLYWHSPIPLGDRGLDWLNRNFGELDDVHICVQPQGYRLILVPLHSGSFDMRDHYDIRRCAEDLQGFIESIPPDRYHVFVFGLEPLSPSLLYPAAIFAPKPKHALYMVNPTGAAKSYAEDVKLYGFDEVPYARPQDTPACARRSHEVIHLDISSVVRREQRMAIAANITVGMRTSVILHEHLKQYDDLDHIPRAPEIIEHYLEPAISPCSTHDELFIRCCIAPTP